MMYKVRLQYAINVEAPSSSDAVRKTANLIRNEPGLAIKGVESPYKHRSVWKMLLFGY